MVLEPEEWPVFASYLEDLKVLKESFLRSEIIYVPKTQNTKADNLARSVRKQTVFCHSHGSRSPDLVHRVSMNLYKLMTKKKSPFGVLSFLHQFLDHFIMFSCSQNLNPKIFKKSMNMDNFHINKYMFFFWNCTYSFFLSISLFSNFMLFFQ